MGDPFEQDPEDLGGQVKILSQTPAFTGTYSRVYRGQISQSGELVAVKVLNGIKGAVLHTMRRKVKRERITWGAVKHPNILPLYGFADDEEQFQPFGALISPWRQAGDASIFLSDHEASLIHEDRMKLWQDVIEGVKYLHSFQPVLIHGDLKPLNILIDDDGRAQLCDFGLVRIIMEGRSSGMTTTTAHTGTTRYFAYELVVAGDDACPTTASDIYAVGCIGLEFIFSRIPYPNRRSSGAILMDIRAGYPPAVPSIDLSPDLKSIWATLEDCWNINPSKRPSAASLLARFEGHPAGLSRQSSTLELFNDNTELTGPTEQGAGAPDENKRQVIDAVENVAVSGLAAANSLDIPKLSANIDEAINVDIDPNPDMDSTPELLMSSRQPTAAFEEFHRSKLWNITAGLARTVPRWGYPSFACPLTLWKYGSALCLALALIESFHLLEPLEGIMSVFKEPHLFSIFLNTKPALTTIEELLPIRQQLLPRRHPELQHCQAICKMERENREELDGDAAVRIAERTRSKLEKP